MSTELEQRVPDGAPIYELTADLVALLAQPEMAELRSLLTPHGAKLLLAQLGSMDRESLLSLRARITPHVPSGPAG